MNESIFQRCFEELIKKEEFDRIHFLKLMAQICHMQEHKQIHLSFYAFYQLVYIQNHKLCLQTIEKGIQIMEQSLPASILFAIKAALLTNISKHTQALQCFKEAIQIIHQIKQNKAYANPLHSKIFAPFMAQILLFLNLSRGRRQFLVMLDEVKGEVQGNIHLNALQTAVNARMNQIRESMRCIGKAQHEKKLLMSSSSMGTLTSNKHEKQQQSNTSIYINRLYEERRKNLGEREQSRFKKATINNPYQLNLSESKHGGECFLM